jgi:hypothetical protein
MKAVEAPEPARPLGGEAAPIEVPPLNESDAVVRELVRQLSSHPRLTAWLATDGLVRNFTVVVANIADGTEVTTLLRPLRPSGAFGVVERGGSLYIDPRSYERYAGLAEGIGALDPAGTARLYATLKPRIEEAYGELGARETFDRTLERALVRLLETPATPGLVPVEPGGRGIGYVFVDDRLEGLTPAQRQLLRMGPENVRIIQTKIREVALALGIPPQRLPAVAR